MNPGPAPTLLNDYMTPALMWAIVATFCAGVVVWMVTEFLKTWHAKSVELDQVLKDGPPPRNCQIYGCHQVGTHLFDFADGARLYYTCTPHANLVRDWTGPYDRTVEAVYDQDLDQASDLGIWNDEMTS